MATITEVNVAQNLTALWGINASNTRSAEPRSTSRT